MTAPRFAHLGLEPLRWWDIPAVAAIEQQLFATDSPWPAATFWSELAQRHYFLAVWDERELVGYAGLASYPDDAQVQTIAVLPRYQRAGIGRRLLTALIAHAGGQPISLEVRTDNAPAIGLYESMGFTRSGLRRRYYQPSGADAYTMLRTG